MVPVDSSDFVGILGELSRDGPLLSQEARGFCLKAATVQERTA